MSARLTRQEIKRDEVIEKIGGFVGFIQTHGKTIALCAVALVVLILAGLGYRSIARGKADAGGVALGKALTAYQAPVDAEAADPESETAPVFADEESRTARALELFTGVLEEFGGTDAGDIAGAYLGSIAASTGDLDGARDRWQRFLDSQPGNLILSQEIRLNLMSLDRATGRGEQLVDELRAELSGTALDLPEELLLQQLALTLEELGRDAEALDIYRRLAQDFPLSPHGRAATARISELEDAAV